MLRAAHAYWGLPAFASLSMAGSAGSTMPWSRRDPRLRTRRLYWSLSGRLGCTKTQLDVLHYFSNIYAPVSVSRTRQVIDIRTASAANQNCIATT